MARPYGSEVKRGPTIFVQGSWAARPSRIESSVEIAATSPCCSSTRQSVQNGTATGMGCEDAALMLAMEVDPVVAHTRFPPRSARLLAGELASTRTRWPASKYTVEKSTSWSRAQLIV